MQDFIINWHNYSAILSECRISKDWERFDQVAEQFSKFQDHARQVLKSRYTELIDKVNL